jgi:hypothetical protein
LVGKEKSKVGRFLSLARYESIKMAQKKPNLKKAAYKNKPHRLIQLHGIARLRRMLKIFSWRRKNRQKESKKLR